MSSPFEILGLQPGCTEDELRKAYSRLLKQHRPDKDPEGFRRIRDAYEFLRAILPHTQRAEQQQAETVPAPATSDAAQESAAPTESPSAAAKAADVPADAAATPAKNPRDAEALIAEQLERLRADAPVAFEAAQSPPDIPDSRGEAIAAIEEIRANAKEGEWFPVRERLEALREKLARDPSPDTAEAMLQGAMLIAILDWALAQQLANLVYPHLDPFQRSGKLEQLDWLIQVSESGAHGRQGPHYSGAVPGAGRRRCQRSARARSHRKCLVPDQRPNRDGVFPCEHRRL